MEQKQASETKKELEQETHYLKQKQTTETTIIVGQTTEHKQNTSPPIRDSRFFITSPLDSIFEDPPLRFVVPFVLNSPLNLGDRAQGTIADGVGRGGGAPPRVA